jgi:hypothetical protein
MKKTILLLALINTILCSDAQVVINEGSNRNGKTIADEDGEFNDWIELYNAGTAGVQLQGWFLSDKGNQPQLWEIPGLYLEPQGFRIVFCSGKDKSGTVHHWESAVLPTDLFQYEVADDDTPSNWMLPGFDDLTWGQGQAGFGFSDGDDVTLIDNDNVAVYIRKAFMIPDTSAIAEAILHMDYDDGFIAYLNGTEIARVNMTGMPSWNSYADGDHEAVMYNGGLPEAFILDMDFIKSIWKQGENVLAVEAHNRDISSSDLSLIPFLSFGINNPATFFQPLPSWFLSTSGTNYHTNFKLERTGETVYLSNPSGVQTDSLVIGNDLAVNYSDGRVIDGSGTTGIFIVPTPGATNNTSVPYTMGYEPAPEFSAPAGYYGSSINISITSESPGTVIRYTLDGQEPTENAAIYTVPIAISQSKVVKARVFGNTGKLPSPVTTATYLVNAIDHTTPVLSVTINQEDLFGPEGIYDNWWTDWKKYCHIEYFEKGTHELAFSQDAAIKIDGGAGGSRSLPQKSFRVEPGHGVYGDGDLDYPLLASRPDRDDYETFYLRNGSNQYLNFPIKEAIESKSMGGEGTFNYYSGYNTIAVYLNGQFWGIYELREKLDADYFKQYDDADKDSLDLLSVSYWYGGQLRAVEGSVDPFWNDYNNFLALSPGQPQYLSQVGQFLDLENYTDYIIAEQWIGNTDWPWNNIKLFRSNATDWRWRFGLIDLEWAMEPNGWTDHFSDMIEYCLNNDPNIPYIRFWQNLVQNHLYHDYYINRFADVMNTAYHFDRLGAVEMEIYEEALPEMPHQYARWGEGPSIQDYMNVFNQSHNDIRNAFLNRSTVVRDDIKNHFELPKKVLLTLDVVPAQAGKIKISTISPDVYPWTGIYFDGVPVKIEAIPNPGYEFDFWEQNPLLTDLSNPVFLDTITLNNTDFVAHFGLITKAENPDPQQLMIYPNPTSGLVMITLPADVSPDNRIEVYDISGKLVLEKSTGQAVQNQCSFNLEKYPAGVYTIKMQGENRRYVAKIVKE